MKTPYVFDKLEIERKYNKIVIPKSAYSSIMGKFTSTLRKNIKDEDLTILYNNINEVKVIDMKDSINPVDSELTLGRYESIHNVLEFNPMYLNIMYHELFHLASSCIDSDQNMYFSGFSQLYYDLDYSLFGTSIKETKYDCGDGLNEIYTQILTERYFNKECEHRPLPETKYVLMLECLLGKEAMTSYYLNADLKSFVDSYSKYTNEKDVLNFIVSMDNSYGTLTNPDISQSTYLQKKYYHYLKKVAYYTYKLLNTYINGHYNDTGINLYEELEKIQYPNVRSNYFKTNCEFDQLLGAISGSIQNKIRRP